jgi:predicted amidohydrolase YtcJ
MRQQRLFAWIVAAPAAFVACLVVAGSSLGSLGAQSAPPATSARDRAFVNGPVFDGQRFVAAPLSVAADGRFSRSRSADAEVVDLAGGYVIPPFGEGHNHNVDSEAALDRYLKAGIFYVSNPQ